MLDYIIVGQGIAGSMLSWFLMKENQQVLVIDKYNPSSASNIASGVTNPITGRRFVKSWLADDIIPFAGKTYLHFETIFQDIFFRPVGIVKIFDSVAAQNDWSVRCASPVYLPYLTKEAILTLDPQKVRNTFGGFEISGGSKLETRKFLAHYRNFLLSNQFLLEEKFSFDKLIVAKDSVAYKSYNARRLIFCEGAEAFHNPFFKFLPFQLAKGECLIIRIEDFYPDRIINGEVFIMPMQEENLYYVGATHEWNFDDDLPTDKGRNELLGNLRSVLNAPFEIVEHKAAIRPTVKDRRPFIGFHPEFSNIGIFNGLGTKGISLAPYFANHFVEHLCQQKSLMKEIDIYRFLL